ncbi:MAG: AzlD domain-containing protein [Desulfovibrionaceae bacterium]
MTYLPRFLPALALSTRRLPDGVARWLSYVPTAVLSALLAQSIAAPAGAVWLRLDNLFLVVGLPTLAFGWVTKNFFGTVAFGLACVAGARALGLG